MKTRLEVVTNVIVILVAVVIGSVYLKDRFVNPSPEADQVKAGDKLASLEGWDWGTGWGTPKADKLVRALAQQGD